MEPWRYKGTDARDKKDGDLQRAEGAGDIVHHDVFGSGVLLGNAEGGLLIDFDDADAGTRACTSGHVYVVEVPAAGVAHREDNSAGLFGSDEELQPKPPGRMQARCAQGALCARHVSQASGVHRSRHL